MRYVLPLAGILLCVPAVAQTPPPDTSPPLLREHTTLVPSVAAPSGAAYDAAVEKMHRAMNIPYSGDADRDFVAAMIPLSQGAVDIARVALQHVRDPQIRKLAQDTIAAQEQQVALLRQWQAAHSR